jgi:hypothetical protein
VRQNLSTDATCARGKKGKKIKNRNIGRSTLRKQCILLTCVGSEVDEAWQFCRTRYSDKFSNCPFYRTVGCNSTECLCKPMAFCTGKHSRLYSIALH